MVGRQRSKQVHVTHGPVDHEDARRVLADLVDVYDRGQREPLPVPVETGLAYATAALEQDDVVFRARAAWETSDRAGAVPGEQDDPAQVRLHGRRAPIDVLLTPPRPDERWVAGEGTRLGQYARRLWTPVLSGPERRVLL